MQGGFNKLRTSHQHTKLTIAFFCITLVTLIIIGGFRMHNVYGNSYIISEDEIFQYVVDFSVSDTHSLYLYNNDGNQKLFVQGINTYGALGTKDTEDYFKLTEILVGLPESKIIKVWALNNASFLLTESGHVYACGRNYNGKLGVASDDLIITSFTEVELPVEAMGHIADIQGNGDFTIFKTDIGKFYGSGDNSHGQLGLSEDVQKVLDIDSVPVIEIATNVTDVYGEPVIVKDMAAGLHFTVLIDDSPEGNVYFAGNNTGNPSNGAKQSATDFLPNIVYDFSFVTNVKALDELYYFNEGQVASNYHIHASNEFYAVTNSITVSHFLKEKCPVFNAYEEGEEVTPEIFVFTSLFDTLDASDLESEDIGVDALINKNFADILGSDIEIHGIRYTGFIKEDDNFQFSTSKKCFGFLNEGFVFWLTSPNTNKAYVSYFGYNNTENINNITWLNNEGFLNADTHPLFLNDENTTIHKLAVSSQTLIYALETPITTAICAAGNNNMNQFGHVGMDVVYINQLCPLFGQWNNIIYPFYASDISPTITHYNIAPGETTTISFNSINRPNLFAETNFESQDNLIFSEIWSQDNILKGLEVQGLRAGLVTIAICDRPIPTEPEAAPQVLFFLTFNIAVDTYDEIAFEHGLKDIVIGDDSGLDVIFLAPSQYAYGIDFELRASQDNVVSFTMPELISTDNGISRYYTKAKAITSISNTIDLELWNLQGLPECITSKQIDIVDPVIEKIDIGFAIDMPTSLYVDELINVMNYVTPKDEATNMSYSIIDGAEYLLKINPSIGTFQGVFEGKATIRINHPHAITHKDFLLTVKSSGTIPSDDMFVINSSMQEINLIVGESQTLSYSTTPSGKESDIVITSDNPQVCTVDTNTNKVTAVGAGTTYIRLTSNKAVSPLLIPVTVDVSTIIDAPESMTIRVGESQRIPVYAHPANITNQLTYSSSNLNIAVSQDGRVTGVATGTSILTITLPTNNTTKTIVVNVLPSKNNDDNNHSSLNPRLVLNNPLNEKGELEIVLGGKIELNARVVNYSKTANIQYQSKDTSIADIVGTTLIGKKVGKTTCVISSDVGTAALIVHINVIKAPYIEDSINIRLDKVATEIEKPKETNKDIPAITLQQDQKYQINATGIVKGVDLEKYFDDYFTVSVDENAIAYLGKGVIQAKHPGKTTLYLYKKNQKTPIAKVNIVIPYPADFFCEMPAAMGVPFNRTLKITFNQNILPSSVTEDSVFVQTTRDGNGQNLDRIAVVSKNELNIKIPIDNLSSKTQTMYIFITSETTSTSHAPVFKPMVIPVVFEK